MAARRNFGGKTVRKIRIFGPFLIAVSVIVIVVGGFLQWKLYRLSKHPLSIAQVSEEKHLVNSIQEATVALLNTKDGVSFASRLEEVRADISSWKPVHRKLVRATRRQSVPAEVRDPLSERVFPLYGDIVASAKTLFFELDRGYGSVSIPALRPFVQTLQEKTELYLFYLDHLDLKLAKVTQAEIGRLRWMEGVLITGLGGLLLALTIWLFLPAGEMIERLVGQMNQILRRLRKKNRSLRRLQILVKERLQLALSVSKTGTFVWNENADRLEWDRNLADLFGLNSAGEIRKLEDFLKRVKEEDREKVRRHIKRTIAEGRDMIDMRVEVNGETRWLRDHSLMMRQGDEIKIIGACTDQTELIREIDSSRRAKSQAEKANRSKTEFIANISHDMRTPLTAILGFIDILSKEKRMEEERRNQVLELIEKNGRSLLRFIEDLLDVTRIESGNESVSLKPFSLKKLMNDLYASFQVRCESKNLGFAIRYHDDIPDRLVCDPVIIERIATNLISNAIRYSDRGQIVVDIFLAPPAAGTNQYSLAVTVSDEGRGICPSKQQQIFDAFSAREDVSDTHRSMGLGLYVSKKLTSTLGGSLVLERSEVGVGSVFRFTVPVKKADSEEKTGGELPRTELRLVKKNEFSELRALVVEDDPNLQELMRAILHHLGVDCEVVAAGEEALDVLKDNVFDLVTMDIRLPGMDGVEVTEKLRQRGYDGYIVAVSAHAFSTERSRAMEAGCDDYLTKPIDIGKLTGILRTALQRKGEGSTAISKAGGARD